MLASIKKNTPQLFEARPKFHMISDQPDVSLGIVDCSLYIRLVALNDDYHIKRIDMRAYSLGEQKTLGKF